MKADLVVYDRHGQIVLVAEIKRKTGGSPEWAAEWRRKMLSHGVLPETKFFMIALPDRFYLWKDAGNIPESTAPTFEIDAEPLLKPYLEGSGVSSGEISPQSFELIVSAWLNSVLRAGESANGKDEGLNWIKTSGFSEAVKGGRMQHKVVL
ncbi:MAG: hypothetical protein V8K32_08400 [Candidatus Electrothrix gigas]